MKTSPTSLTFLSLLISLSAFILLALSFGLLYRVFLTNSLLSLFGLVLCISAAAQFIVYRYIILSLAPLYFVSLICISSLLTEKEIEDE